MQTHHAWVWIMEVKLKIFFLAHFIAAFKTPTHWSADVQTEGR